MGDAPLLPAKPTYPRSHAAASIAIYLTIVSIVPLLNKRIMRGQTGAAPFPCPLTLTALTSCTVSAMLLTLSTAKHLCWDGGAAEGFRQAPPPPVPMPISHFLVRPWRAAAVRTNA